MGLGGVGVGGRERVCQVGWGREDCVEWGAVACVTVELGVMCG